MSGLGFLEKIPNRFVVADVGVVGLFVSCFPCCSLDEARENFWGIVTGDVVSDDFREGLLE